MPTVQGTIYKGNGDPVTTAQRMRWYKDSTLMKDFPSEADGDYCTVLASANYSILIGAYVSNPPTCTVTTAPLQTQDFRRTTILPDYVEYQGAILEPVPLRATKEGDICVYIECPDPGKHKVHVSGEASDDAHDVGGRRCACFEDKPHGTHKLKVANVTCDPGEIDVVWDSQIVRVKCKASLSHR